jgi:hypothetical protein
MAGVVKWKPISCKQMEHTRVVPERLSLRSNSPKNHNSRHIGHFAKDGNFICHSLQSVSQAMARQYVIVKVHNKDTDQSCDPEFDHEDNVIIPSPSQRKEGNQLRALESYFSKLNSTQQLCSWPQKNKHKNGPSSSNEVDAIIVNVKNMIDSLQVQFDRGNTGKSLDLAVSTDVGPLKLGY